MQGTMARQRAASPDRPHKTYRDLKIWQKGMDIATTVHRLTQRFPKEELFGVTQTMRLAASEIACMIADGYRLKTGGGYLAGLQASMAASSRLETALFSHPDNVGNASSAAIATAAPTI
ncbi:MAG: four helix bundle protein [Verrucomicrobia bacterium]|nr:four helix bundle protein [Verrucomicrobiota bacterium]